MGSSGTSPCSASRPHLPALAILCPRGCVDSAKAWRCRKNCLSHRSRRLRAAPAACSPFACDRMKLFPKATQERQHCEGKRLVLLLWFVVVGCGWLWSVVVCRCGLLLFVVVCCCSRCWCCVAVLDADIQKLCVCQQLLRMNWQAGGDESPGSKTPGDSVASTPRRHRAKNCEKNTTKQKRRMSVIFHSCSKSSC